jgi:amino acid exporter
LGGSAGAFGRGLLTNLSNPHTVIFFVGIFSTMLSPSIPSGERAVVLFAVIAMSVTWYTTVAVALSSVRAQSLYGRTARAIDVVAGTVMVWFAARFVLSSMG